MSHSRKWRLFSDSYLPQERCSFSFHIDLQSEFVLLKGFLQIDLVLIHWRVLLKFTTCLILHVHLSVELYTFEGA